MIKSITSIVVMKMKKIIKSELNRSMVWDHWIKELALYREEWEKFGSGLSPAPGLGRL